MKMTICSLLGCPQPEILQLTAAGKTPEHFWELVPYENAQTPGYNRG